MNFSDRLECPPTLTFTNRTTRPAFYHAYAYTPAEQSRHLYYRTHSNNHDPARPHPSRLKRALRFRLSIFAIVLEAHHVTRTDYRNVICMHISRQTDLLSRVGLRVRLGPEQLECVAKIRIFNAS